MNLTELIKHGNISVGTKEVLGETTLESKEIIIILSHDTSVTKHALVCHEHENKCTDVSKCDSKVYITNPDTAINNSMSFSLTTR